MSESFCKDTKKKISQSCNNKNNNNKKSGNYWIYENIQQHKQNYSSFMSDCMVVIKIAF